MSSERGFDTVIVDNRGNSNDLDLWYKNDSLARRRFVSFISVVLPCLQIENVAAVMQELYCRHP